MSGINIDPEIFSVFVLEAQERINRTINHLLNLEKNGIQISIINDIKREVHTLKGAAKMLGLKNINQATHILENFFKEFEENPDLINNTIITNMLYIMDNIEKAINKLPDEEIQIDISSLENLDISHPPESKKEIPPFQIFEQEEKEPDETDIIEKTSRRSEFIYVKGDKVKSLLNFCNIFNNYYGRFDFFLNQLKDFSNYLQNDEENRVFEKILNQYEHEINFYKLSARQLQDNISELLLVPLSSIFNNLPRLVRDISLEKGKKSEIVITGSEVGIDKRLIEDVKIMLMHIIRNAIDHGIEMPEERKAKGKTECGRIELKAAVVQDNIIIELKDDGKGLDIELIKQKAIKQNMVSKEKAESLSKEQIIDFIFQSGFSTAEQVTDISGRGVGMDIVADIMRALNSELIVSSEFHHGTQFILKLPLITSLYSITVFETAQQIFAIPSSYILSIIDIKKDKIKIIDRKLFYQNNEQYIQLFYLDTILKLHNFDNPNDTITLVLKIKNNVIGLVVSKVLFERKMVVKQLTALRNKTEIAAGLITLGSNKTVVVLNLLKMFELKLFY
ncbi:MAG: hypothetical protein A2Y41_12260 [Spirochaetes bacterium GWB1_36_13]|nr:MAG: hypothetical protein A2Y41_12260 [Spirochaetes bacterium GWB1_36_13]